MDNTSNNLKAKSKLNDEPVIIKNLGLSMGAIHIMPIDDLRALIRDMALELENLDPDSPAWRTFNTALALLNSELAIRINRARSIIGRHTKLRLLIDLIKDIVFVFKPKKPQVVHHKTVEL